MRHTLVFLMLAGVISVLACGSESNSACTQPGGTCVTKGSGLVCQETLPYDCNDQGAICCIVKK